MRLNRFFQFLFIFLALHLAGCASDSSSGLGDLPQTWQRAFVSMPDKMSPDRLRDRAEDLSARLGASGSAPVVLYMHGCTGVTNGDLDLLKDLSKAGYYVFAPDSMARSYRPLQCDPRSQTGGFNTFVYDLRMAEASYALQQVLAYPGVDPERIYLMGGSEGGVIAALHRSNRFRARVVFQWTCHGSPLVRGISEAGEPLLSIVQADDPWYSAQNTPGQAGDCGAYFTDRENSQSVILTDGDTHDVISNPVFIEAVLDFLAKNR